MAITVMRLISRRALCRVASAHAHSDIAESAFYDVVKRVGSLREMDDSLLADFHAVFSVSSDVNAPTRPHPTYASLYKQKRHGFGEQEARRRRILEDQRSRRRNYADYVRKIAAGEEWEEEMEEDESGDDEERDEVDFHSKKVSSKSNHTTKVHVNY